MTGKLCAAQRTPVARITCPTCPTRFVPNIFRVTVVAAALLFCALPRATLGKDASNIQRLLEDDFVNTVQYSAPHGEVKRLWGIPDTTAFVGRIFNYSVPEDAFSGKIYQYKMTEAGEDSLPFWLQFNPLTKTFAGVPMEKDIGQHYISVKAYGRDREIKSKSVAKDVFSIDIVDEPVESNSVTYSNQQQQKCPGGEPLTVASVILDVGMEELPPTDRVHLLQKAGSAMGLPLDTLKLSSLLNSKLFDSAALMAGPGNTHNAKTTGTKLQWQVGCSGVVRPDQLEKLTEVEKLSKDGTLAEELKVPIIGWHVSNFHAPLTHREKRRAPPISGTPVPGVIPSRWPSFTEKVEEGTTDESLTPESRIVPTMTSPIFTQTTHHHRHHHGEDVGFRERGEHIHDSVPIHVTTSPTAYHRFPQSPSFMATPPLVPELATRFVSVTPVIDTGPSRTVLEELTPTGVLQPAPTAIVTETDLQPSYTSETYPSKPVEPIKPTKTKTTVHPTKKPPSVANFKPTIRNRMKKLSMIAGKIWKFTIPEDTFADFEDGNTRNLKLLFMSAERTAISFMSWIQFDPENQTLYALPLEENVGKYEFILEAMDSEGATSFDKLDIHVWQHPSDRAVHHEFTLTFAKAHKWQYPVGIDWQIAVVHKLEKLYGDKNDSNIIVRSATLDPVSISWTNDSLAKHPCPKGGIAKLKSRLVNEETGEITRQLKKTLGQEFKVQDVSVSYIGVCSIPVSSTSPTHTNTPPELRNPIEQINATVGEILRYKVPDDMFYDRQDGNTRYLQLSFLTIDSKRPPKSSWVQLDPKSQEMYGLPFENDVGRHEFLMAAIDSEGQQASDAFVIVVHQPPPRNWGVEFSIHLDEDYSEFVRNTSRKVLVAWKLCKVFGDPDPKNIKVTSIVKGSVVYAWTNKTLPYDPCPTDQIRSLYRMMFYEDETVSARLVDAMKPEFHVIKANAIPMGVCLGQVDQTSVTRAPLPPTTTKEMEPASTEGDDDVYITTIIPAVLIAIMLIIAAMVACFLYRKKRKGKMTMQDNSTFISKGIPIIFADELDDKPDPAKPPIIMKEEKPPLAPTDYPRSVSASSRDSTPRTDRRDVQGHHHHGRDTSADLHSDPHFSPPYQPPPPFTSSRVEKNSRPKVMPTYRQPPAYVPP